MNNEQLFSRRDTEHKVDFRPDIAEGSPYVQLRRLAFYLQSNVAEAGDITDCPQAIDALREFSYRKIFTGTSHADFVELDATDPKHIDWSIAVHAIEADRFRNANRKDSPGESNHFQTRKQPR